MENGTLSIPGTAGWQLEQLHPVCCGEVKEQAVLAVRPEDILVVTEGEHLTAQVAALQTLGKEVYLRLRHGEYTLTACLSWDHDYSIGDTLKLKLRKCYLFAAEGGL